MLPHKYQSRYYIYYTVRFSEIHRMDRAENIAPHCTETVPAELTLHDLNPQQYQHVSKP